jgi:hypothetical protein
MLKRIAAAFALSMMLVASCSNSDSTDSNGFSCDTAKSSCPGDPPLDPAECKRIVGDPTCGNVFMDFFLCVGVHQKCLDDGTTDQSVTARECAAQQNAAIQCAASIDAGRG